MFINSESIWIKRDLKFVQILTKICQKWEGKKPERFYCRFCIKFNWAEGASGHHSGCLLAAGRISDTLIISCALSLHPCLSKLKFCIISVVLKQSLSCSIVLNRLRVIQDPAANLWSLPIGQSLGFLLICILGIELLVSILFICINGVSHC